MAQRIVLIRHGETEWSRTGRHTGRTDLALTERGEQEARLVVGTLAGWEFEASFSSPLRRALDTARIAGFDPELDDSLMEWDYGQVEGRRNDEITADLSGWSKWTSEVPGGEQVSQVGQRSDQFLASVEAVGGDVAVFAHGHFLSITIARWLGLDAVEGRRFPLATATISVLATKRADRTLDTMNHRCGAHLDEEERSDA